MTHDALQPAKKEKNNHEFSLSVMPYNVQKRLSTPEYQPNN